MSEVATLAGGCFWCLEEAYRQLRGVESVQSGYTGGHVKSPSYRAVCGGDTGHAEAVQVKFDPSKVTFGDLLDVFFTIHDPTQLNRQGGDVGEQYRSEIFYHSPDQKATAERKIAELTGEGVWDAPIVTKLSPLTEFYPAEVEHAEYYARNPEAAYCAAVIAPKIAKLRRYHFDKLRATPAPA